MARLPIPGSDDGQWGSILNGFLLVAHASDGNLLTNSVGSAALQDNSVVSSKLAAGSSADGQVLTKDSAQSGGIKWAAAPTASPATAGSLGTIQLAGDLGGAATSPTVPGLAFTLLWSGSDYTPTSLKSNTSRPKRFIGPTDPSSVSGVVLTVYDEWDQTSS